MARSKIRIPGLRRGARSPQAWAVLVVLALGLAAVRACEKATPGSLEDARSRRVSDVWIETSGRVVHLLPDDRQGDRHQKILLDVGHGETLLVVHNIDVAERVPADEGDVLEVRGEYVWNEKGGLIHFTHDASSGRRPGGWIRHDGRTYR